MADHYDHWETAPAADRERRLFDALPGFLSDTVADALGWADRLAGHDLSTVTSRAALAALPITRKTDLMEAQAARPPFGGFTRLPVAGLTRLFLSPGPVAVPQGPEPDPFLTARALHAAGVRAGDVVANTFGYHVTPGAFILESGLTAIGTPIVAAGAGKASEQVATLARLGATVYCGVPDYLNLLLDAADEAGVALAFETALVSGAALPPALRARIEERGCRVTQCYATADIGVIAYESEARDGLILNEGLILEIVRPGTGELVADGEVGEVVVTKLSPSYPLIRFATGDLSMRLDGPSPCGRTNERIRGWMGRADQRTKVKGMFVDPAQIAEIRKRHPDLVKARLTVTRQDHADRMSLAIEGTADPDAVASTLKQVTGLSGEVTRVADGTLANDGKVIADERPVEG